MKILSDYIKNNVRIMVDEQDGRIVFGVKDEDGTPVFDAQTSDIAKMDAGSKVQKMIQPGREQQQWYCCCSRPSPGNA